VYYGERFNAISHLAGAILALAGLVVLVTVSGRGGDPWRIVAVSVYTATLFALYAVSTLYHSLRGRAKAVFRKLDHTAIFLLIAGSYTPFTLVILNGVLGWSLFGAIWALALVGIVHEFWLAQGKRAVAVVIYVTMGWLALIAVVPLVERLSLTGFSWLVIGGLFYTVGIVFYALDKKKRMRHAHGIWHLFVLAGSMSHYFVVLHYVA
jgi:hemolysin III